MGKLDISKFSAPSSPEYESIITSSGLKEEYTNMWGSSFEKVESIELNLLHHYQDEEGSTQPFTLNHEKVNQIMTSAEDIGIVTPLIVRRLSDSSYQIIAGHHRYEAACQLNLLSVPCIVKQITDEEAFQILAESNIQRDRTLPSEYGKIFAVYMKKRDDTDMTAAEIATKFGVSKKTMYRYLNVANLIPDLQKYADEGKLQLAAAEIISAFAYENQQAVLYFLEHSDGRKITPALAKEFAKVIEKQGGNAVSCDEFTRILLQKPLKKYKNRIYNNLLSKCEFDKSEQEMDELVEKLLTEYFESMSQ